MADKKKISVRFYRFKNKLKEKTAGLGGDENVEISPEALAEAEAALADMSEDYPDWVSGTIDKLSEQHRNCVENADKRKEYFQEIREIAHDMKGQGGTFGYPLISAFSDGLYGFADSRGKLTDDHVEIIKAHVDAMRAVISNRVKGDGGEIGAELTKGLEMAIAKYKV
ncbi:MAG: Hpt domain-containing protein [Proteobacteria bacterium]|nr:Hpt domain-containing protein [Pseudomonadota bacterium]